MHSNNSKGIAFKNFRRFEDFPMLNLGPITYMVGRNNSGKSTMVKALLLVMDYLQNQLSDTFAFDNGVLEDANIVTFGRAKKNGSKEPAINFTFRLNDYNINLNIVGLDTSTKPKVDQLNITDTQKGFALFVDYTSRRVRIHKENRFQENTISNEEFLEKMEPLIKELKNAIKKLDSKVSKEALNLRDQLNKLQERKVKYNLANKYFANKSSFSYILEYPLDYQQVKFNDSTLVKDQEHTLRTLTANLHINQLASNLDGMTNHEMLSIQVKEARERLEFAIRMGYQKLEFNNVGSKVLWSTLKDLFNKYEDDIIDIQEDVIEGEEAVELFLSPNKHINFKTEENPLKEIVSTFLFHNDAAHILEIEKRNRGEEDDDEEDEGSTTSDILELYNTKEELNDWIDDLVASFEKESFYYIPANPSKQSALFYLRDKSNALAQAIHEFYQEDIQKGDEEYRFLIQWMKEFEVGKGFSIKFYSGEAYEFLVEDEDGLNHLSDKGMGSLQAMSLILKIATFIRRNKKTKKKITILVEEPELNLHPALQSKLTDIFHYVNTKYHFNFIVETHSEYMIRKSQVYTRNEGYEGQDSFNPNPFKVFYFPIASKEMPYDMIYRNDGKFKNDFKPGFFDVSSDLAFDIL